MRIAEKSERTTREKGEFLMKHKARTKALSWLLSLALALSLLPGMSLTAYADGVSYQEGSWSNNSVAYTAETATNPTPLANDTTEWGNGNWYVVPADGVTISSRITVTGTANLILTDGNTLTASKGITVADGNTLNIYAQSVGDTAGSLRINSVDDSKAGIGGEFGQNAGTVIIHGGKITVKGGTWYGAGIGGGSGSQGGGNGGTVTLYGGAITATGGMQAAGIGGGYKGNGGTVTLYGGAITAAGGDSAAGIGGGYKGSNGGAVTINGGTVTAKGGMGGAGIGGGSGSNGGIVTINGGTVTATGGNGGTGIGSGLLDMGNESSGIGGSVTINGGTVTATGGDDMSMGIGGVLRLDQMDYGTQLPPKNGSLSVGSGLKVYGGNSANPTTELTQFSTIYRVY